MANSWWDDIKELFKTKKQKAAEENEKVKKEQVKRIRRQGCQVIGTLAGGLSFQNKGWNL